MGKKKWLVISFLLCCAFLWAAAGCEPEEDVVHDLQYEDGVYTAVSQEDRGYVEVTLTVENDEITDVEIVEYDELGVEKIYEDYHERFPELEEAHETLASRLMEENTWDIDGFTGATSTSDKVSEAARFALEKAGVEEPDNKYFDGRFMGISDATERGWGIAYITIENDEIVDVELEETMPAQEDGEDVFDAVDRQVFELKEEDYDWDEFHEAQEVIAERILESQSHEVDTYTEATGSSENWMQAVKRALVAAEI